MPSSCTLITARLTRSPIPSNPKIAVQLVEVTASAMRSMNLSFHKLTIHPAIDILVRGSKAFTPTIKNAEEVPELQKGSSQNLPERVR